MNNSDPSHLIFIHITSVVTQGSLLPIHVQFYLFLNLSLISLLSGHQIWQRCTRSLASSIPEVENTASGHRECDLCVHSFCSGRLWNLFQKKYFLELAMVFKSLKTEENSKSGRMELRSYTLSTTLRRSGFVWYPGKFFLSGSYHCIDLDA